MRVSDHGLWRSLGGLAKTSLREQALDVLRNAVTSGEIRPEPIWWKRNCPRRCRSPAAPCARRCGSWSRRAWSNPPNGAGSGSAPSVPPRSRTCSRSAPPWKALPPSCCAGIKNRRPVVRQLQTALDALAAATGSISDMVEIDLDFHRTLCTLTGNTALLRSWEGLAGSIRMSIMFAGTDRALANMSVPRHQVLVDAVAAGDPDQARIAVEEHMREAASTLISDLQLAPAHRPAPTSYRRDSRHRQPHPVAAMTCSPGRRA